MSHPLRSTCRIAALVLLASITCRGGDLGDPSSWARHGEHLIVPREAWTIYLGPRLLEEDPEATHKMLALLDGQLKRVEAVVPAPALKMLRTVPIWINPTYKGQRPGAEYHPDAGWLRGNGRDPAMARCIEITNVSIFPQEEIRMPYLLLHELAHAYHDQVLGFDDAEILAAYRKVAKAGSYDAVERFSGGETSMEKAYAMTDHKEYFAETTEAFFGKNDFFPFTAEELRKHDPDMHALLARKWEVPAVQDEPVSSP